MESVSWPMISLTVFLTLLFAAALLFLYLQAMRSLSRQSQEQATFLQQMMEVSTKLALNSSDNSDSQMATMTKFLEDSSAKMQVESQRMQELAQKSMDLTLMRSLDGIQKALTMMSTLATSTTAMLGTKDPLAYQQVLAPALPREQGNEPYTSVDEYHLRSLAEQQEALDSFNLTDEFFKGLGVDRGSARSASDTVPAY